MGNNRDEGCLVGTAMQEMALHAKAVSEAPRIGDWRDSPRDAGMLAHAIQAAAAGRILESAKSGRMTRGGAMRALLEAGHSR